MEIVNQVAVVPAADLTDARRLMRALGHQPEDGDSFSAERSDGSGNTTHYLYHAWHKLLPDELPGNIVWADFGLTEARAQAVFALIVRQETREDSPVTGEPTERAKAVAAAVGVAPAWKMLDGGWAKDSEAAWDGHVWTSTIDNNVWAPGVEGWAIKSSPGEIPPWVQPGSTNPYPFGAVVTFDGRKKRSLHPANVWSPAAAPDLWADEGAIGGGGEPDIEAWAPGTNYMAGGEERSHGSEEWVNRRPNNTQQLAPGVNGSGWMRTSNRPAPWYNLGNEGYLAEWAGTPMRVTHNGKLWRNPTNSNNWTPGVAIWIDEGPV